MAGNKEIPENQKEKPPLPQSPTGNNPAAKAMGIIMRGAAALDKMQGIAPKAEIPAGFAKLAKPTEAADSLKNLSAQKKLELLQKDFEERKLTEKQKLNVQNLMIIKEMWAVASGFVNMEVAHFSNRYWKKVSPNRIPNEPNWFTTHFNDLVLKASSDENFSLRKELPSDVAAFMNRMLKSSHVDVSDVTNQEQLLEKQNQYIASLRRQGRYDELESQCEQALTAEFKKGIDMVNEQEKNEIHLKSERNIANQLTDKVKIEWAKKGMNPDQIAELQQKLIEADYQRALHHTAAEKFLENKIPIIGAKAKIWEQYKDIYDPKNEWLKMSDATWNMIIKEIAINAPLIILSGGVAAGVRAGLSAGAKRFLVKAGIEFAGKTLAQRTAIGVGAYAVGQYVEGAAFDVVHRVLQGEWYKDLPDFAKSTLMSAATLGLFHGAGKLTEAFFTKEIAIAGGKIRLPRQNFLAQEIAKIKNPSIQKVVKQLILKGHVEAATMVFTSAVQHGLYAGDIDEFWNAFNGDEIFHAYVSVASLKAGGAAAGTITGSKKASTKKAKDSHYESIFSSEIPEGFKAEGKEAKDVAGWIDKNGKIHYGSKYFEKNFGVKLAQKDGKNIFVANGKEMSPKDFLKNHPRGREVIDAMKKVKDHEVTHRLLEAAENRSGNSLSQKLQALFATNKEFQMRFMESGKTMNFKDVQEFICEVADGRVSLTAETRHALEGVIGEFIPNFSFSRVRRIDTGQLAVSAPEDFLRKVEDALWRFTGTKKSEKPAVTPATKSKLEGVQVGDFIVARSGDRRKVLEIKDGNIRFLRTEPSGRQYEEVQRWNPKANDGWVQEIIRLQPRAPKKVATELFAFQQFVENNRQSIETGIRQGRSLQDIFYDLYCSENIAHQMYRPEHGDFEQKKVQYEIEAADVLRQFLAFSERAGNQEVPPISPGRKSIKKGWVYFKINGGFETGGNIGRLYLNIRPEHLPKFYKEALPYFYRNGLRIDAKISQTGNPQDFNRYDKMVIYFNEKSEQAVAKVMRNLYRQNSQIFLDGTPRFTSPVVDGQGNIMKGVGFGEEPAGEGKQGSFGDVRGKILSDVYEAAQRDNFSLDDPRAQSVFENSCRRHGIDPQQAAFNSNTSGPQSFPFMRAMGHGIE